MKTQKLWISRADRKVSFTDYIYLDEELSKEDKKEYTPVIVLTPEVEAALKAFEATRDATISANWFADHIMDAKAKRVDWGQTFDMDWGKINASLIAISNGKRVLNE